LDDLFASLVEGEYQVIDGEGVEVLVITVVYIVLLLPDLGPGQGDLGDWCLENQFPGREFFTN